MTTIGIFQKTPDGSFHGAVDNVMLSAGGQSLAANFEDSAPPPPPPAPAPVPTLGEWSLLLTGLLLAVLGSRQAAGRRRTRNGG